MSGNILIIKTHIKIIIILILKKLYNIETKIVYDEYA